MLLAIYKKDFSHNCKLINKSHKLWNCKST